MRSCTESPQCGAEYRVGTQKCELFFWPSLEGKISGEEYILPFSPRKVFPREDLGPKHKRRKQKQTWMFRKPALYKAKARFGDSMGLFQKARDRQTGGWGSCPRRHRETKRRLSCSSGWLYYWKFASCSLRTLGRDTVPPPVPTWTGSDAAGSHGQEASRRGWRGYPQRKTSFLILQPGFLPQLPLSPASTHHHPWNYKTQRKLKDHSYSYMGKTAKFYRNS